MRILKRFYPQFLLLLALVLLLFGIQSLYVGGIVRDEYNVTGGTFLTVILPWMAPLAAMQAMLFLTLMCHERRLQMGRDKKLLIKIIAFLVLSMASLLCTKNMYEKWKNNSDDPMTWISLKALQLSQNEEGLKIYYVMRSDCPACEELTPKLKKMSRREPLEFWCYNTSGDRYDNASEMYRTLALYQIDEVPYIIVWENGEALARFYGESILSDFTEYYQENREKLRLQP